jgi:hypothetical protein
LPMWVYPRPAGMNRSSSLPPVSVLPPAGTSSYRARGSRYTGMLQHAIDRVPGGLDTVCRHLPDDSHREFVRQVFLPVGWYDALPLYALATAIGKAEGRSAEAFLQERTIQAARNDLTGIYKLILRVASAEMVASRLQRATSRFFDFGVSEVVESAQGRSTGRFSQIPRAVGNWCAAVIPGYAVEVLKVAGAKLPRAHVDPLESQGMRDGIEHVQLRIYLTWS